LADNFDKVYRFIVGGRESMRWSAILLLSVVGGCQAYQSNQNTETSRVPAQSDAKVTAHSTSDIVPATGRTPDSTSIQNISFTKPGGTELAASGAREASGSGYLYQTVTKPDDGLRGPANPYYPQPGDIFLSTDHLLIARIGHKLAGASSPHHSGLIIMRQDGSLATLESGPHDTLWVKVLDLQENLGQYEDEGETIWVRRRKTPLTAEQSQRLTDFAMTQNGKLFAWGRVIGQLTPFRSRGPWTSSVGGPHGNRFSYFCSELVLETLVAAGMLDPSRTRPAATYPCDLFYGKSSNSFINENLDINASWEPPAPWSRQARIPNPFPTLTPAVTQTPAPAPSVVRSSNEKE
jgi:hypothetical protein